EDLPEAVTFPCREAASDIPGEARGVTGGLSRKDPGMGTYFPDITSQRDGNRLRVQAGCGLVEFDLASGAMSLGALGPVRVSVVAAAGGATLDTVSSTPGR